MPQMGVSVAEGTVVIWHKQPGDWVEADETICEITTDKIDSEVPAPATGRRRRAPRGLEQTVPVGTPLARIATGQAGGRCRSPRRCSGRCRRRHGGWSIARWALRTAPRRADHAHDSSKPADLGAPAGAPHLRHYSPVVQRIARREGVDLGRVHGTGRGGRVRKQDVLAFLEDRTAGAGATEHANGSAPLHIDSPYRDDEPAAAVPAAVAEQRQTPRARARLAPARRRAGGGSRGCAGRSPRTWSSRCGRPRTAPRSRKRTCRESRRRAPGSGSATCRFVARCVIEALRAHPELNATLEGETLTLHRAVHLGIAVSLGAGTA